MQEFPRDNQLANNHNNYIHKQLCNTFQKYYSIVHARMETRSFCTEFIADSSYQL